MICWTSQLHWSILSWYNGLHRTVAINNAECFPFYVVSNSPAVLWYDKTYMLIMREIVYKKKVHSQADWEHSKYVI